MAVLTFKKGEVIFKEGDKINNLFLIQSGGVSLCLIKGKKNIDLFQLGSQHILGESVLFGQNTHTTSAIATSETKLLEVPVDAVKQNLEGGAPILKVMSKSFADRLKLALNEIKSSKLSTDSSPCPDDQVPQIFSAIYYTLLQKGVKNKSSETVISGPFLKQYAQKVFGQSPKRIEQACNIFVKQKMANYLIGKPPENPEGPDEVLEITFKDIATIEGFFEFYQYYYYKPGKGDYLKIDDTMHALLEILLKCVGDQVPDRFGVVSIPYLKFQDECKSEIGLNLNKDHFNRLEQKGVLCKRNTNKDNSVDIQFDFKEFRNISASWKFLKDIEKWNEKGFVDPNEFEPVYKKKEANTGVECPQCHNPVAMDAKFCQECGYSLKLKAA